MKKQLGWLMAGLVAVNLFAMPVFAEDISSAVSSNEGEKVTVDGENVSIQQNLSDEAKAAEKKRLKHAKKEGKKISRQERKAAKRIRKAENRKERLKIKQEAKLERKKWKKKHS